MTVTHERRLPQEQATETPPLPVPIGLRHYGEPRLGKDGIWRTAKRNGFHLALARLKCGCFAWQEVRGKDAEAREIAFFTGWTCVACRCAADPGFRARLRAEMAQEVRAL
jgi:hypothetical protein